MSYEFQEYVKIPEARISIVIGKGGEVKKSLEKKLNCKIEINNEGDVIIKGSDGLSLLKAKQIIMAIARGFSPKRAMKLLDENITLEIINLQDILGKNKNSIVRQKGRIIGTQGKVREQIERMTNTMISVYGKTVAIIGPSNNVRIAKEAITMLAEGTKHNTVFSFIKKNFHLINDYPFKEV